MNRSVSVGGAWEGTMSDKQEAGPKLVADTCLSQKSTRWRVAGSWLQESATRKGAASSPRLFIRNAKPIRGRIWEGAQKGLAISSFGNFKNHRLVPNQQASCFCLSVLYALSFSAELYIQLLCVCVIYVQLCKFKHAVVHAQWRSESSSVGLALCFHVYMARACPHWAMLLTSTYNFETSPVSKNSKKKKKFFFWNFKSRPESHLLKLKAFLSEFEAKLSNLVRPSLKTEKGEAYKTWLITQEAWHTYRSAEMDAEI